jgi:hypothetical protein
MKVLAVIAGLLVLAGIFYVGDVAKHMVKGSSLQEAVIAVDEEKAKQQAAEMAKQEKEHREYEAELARMQAESVARQVYGVEDMKSLGKNLGGILGSVVAGFGEEAGKGVEGIVRGTVGGLEKGAGDAGAN